MKHRDLNMPLDTRPHIVTPVNQLADKILEAELPRGVDPEVVSCVRRDKPAPDVKHRRRGTSLVRYREFDSEHLFGDGIKHALPHGCCPASSTGFIQS